MRTFASSEIRFEYVLVGKLPNRRIIRRKIRSCDSGIKYIQKWYKLPPCLAHRPHCRSLEVRPDWIVCGIVNGDIHYKDLLGSTVRVGYRSPGPDFNFVLHGLRGRKKHSNGLINQSKRPL